MFLLKQVTGCGSDPRLLAESMLRFTEKQSDVKDNLGATMVQHAI